MGHPQTPTEQIIRNLDTYCTNETVLKDVDLLILTGDLFDRLLHNADDNVVLIHRWITRVLYKCAYLKVAIRIVEGTPSHDRGQSRFFVEQMNNATIPVDLHYATTLSIEYIERFGIHVLYVPDKWRPDTQETLDEVKALLQRHQLTQVDYAIMHGAFEFQLPSIVPEPTHNSDVYLSLVKHFILIGHVHFMARKDRILAAGSYDRLSSGEEGAKGYYDVTVFESGDSTVTFVENRGAKRYDTLDCHGLSITQVNALLKKHTRNLPKHSAVRLRCNPNDPISGDMEVIKTTYPHYHWALLIDTDKKKKQTVIDVFEDLDLTAFEEITPSNLQRLVGEELQRITVDPTTLQRCHQLLTEVL